MSDINQLILDLGGSPSLTRDDLVVSAANIDAVALVEGWPNWQAPWAILIGATGCGKSHLAEIWHAKSGAEKLVDAELTDDALDAAQNGRPILIDGLQADDFDETRLFHLMNAVRTAQSSMLITAETRPDLWSISVPDLLSRIKAATTVEIAPPDDALLRAVALKLFVDRQIQVEAGVVDYIVQRIERSLETVNHLVREIDKVALQKQARVTKPLVRDVIDGLDDGQAELEF